MNLRSHAPEACALAGLSYILELAPLTRIELAFRDRQSRPFARWGQGQLISPGQRRLPCSLVGLLNRLAGSILWPILPVGFAPRGERA